MNGHWNVDLVGEFSPEEWTGFVYEIVNTTSGRKYIGRKLLVKKKTKVTKGKKKRLLVESDWKTYSGSNKTLLEDIEKLGSHYFKFTILKLCKGRGELNYYETKEIFARDCLLDETYYNEWVTCKVARSHLNAQSKTRKRQ